jgi:hypothetical protein
MPTCFSDDKCDGLWKLYIWRQPENLSLLLSRLSCFLPTHVSFWHFFYTGPSSTETIFLSGSTFKPSPSTKMIITPHSPHIPFFIEPTQNISLWRIDSLFPSSPSRTRCARLLKICSPSRQRKHTHQIRPHYVTHVASTHSHPPLTNGVP